MYYKKIYLNIFQNNEDQIHKSVENNVFYQLNSCLLITKHCLVENSPIVKENKNSTD